MASSFCIPRIANRSGTLLRPYWRAADVEKNLCWVCPAICLFFMGHRLECSWPRPTRPALELVRRWKLHAGKSPVARVSFCCYGHANADAGAARIIVDVLPAGVAHSLLQRLHCMARGDRRAAAHQLQEFRNGCEFVRFLVGGILCEGDPGLHHLHGDPLQGSQLIVPIETP